MVSLSYRVLASVADSEISASGLFNGIGYEGDFADFPTTVDVIDDIEQIKMRSSDPDFIDGLTFIQIHINRFGIPNIPNEEDNQGHEATIIWDIDGSIKGRLNIARIRIIDNIPIEARNFKSWSAYLPSITAKQEVFGSLNQIVTNATLSPGNPIQFLDGCGNVYVTVKQGVDTTGTLGISGQIINQRTGIAVSGVEYVTFSSVNLPVNRVTDNIFCNHVIVFTNDLNISKIDVGQIAALRNNRQKFNIKRFSISTKSSGLGPQTLTINLYKITHTTRTAIISPIVLNTNQSAVRIFNDIRIIDVDFSGMTEGFYVELIPTGRWTDVGIIIDYEDIVELGS